MFSDGSEVTRGKKEGRYSGKIKLEYTAGEVVTELSIWGNGAGIDQCNKIKT